ncbi:MAG: hypothetical protein ACI856_002040, partial [Kiritimatiellia bacterium]
EERLQLAPAAKQTPETTLWSPVGSAGLQSLARLSLFATKFTFFRGEILVSSFVFRGGLSGLGCEADPGH